MTAEHYPISLVHPNPLTLPESFTALRGYYRSKLFVAPYSTNTLVAAAGPLFSLLERLCLSPSLPPIEHIRDNIEHELSAFHSKLDATKYPIDLIGIARYMLSATIDELLGKSYLRVYNLAPEFKAFTPLTRDNAQPQRRFFEFIDYLKERPNQYLDVIELVYFCLIIGFEGEHHCKADGRQILDNKMEELYQLIQHYRFHEHHHLFNDRTLAKVEKKKYKGIVVTVGIALSVLTFAFFSSQMLLEHKAKTVLQDHTQLAMLDN